MKKVITPAVREVSEMVCDVTSQPAVAKLTMWFGYGSARDGDVLEVDLGRDAAEEVLTLLQSKYPKFQPEDRHEEMFCRPRCPLAMW